MTTRHISTLHEHDVCDICGRTLLRGEQAEGFLDGHRRYSVCELCKPHALHEGWVREGTIPDYQGPGGASVRRRSLFGRLRGRAATAPARAAGGFADELSGEDPDARPVGGRGADRERSADRGRGRRAAGNGNGRIPVDEQPQASQGFDDEMSTGAWPPPPDPVSAPVDVLPDEPDGHPDPAPPRRGRPRAPARREPVRPSRRDPGFDQGREPRRVHAVPTGEQQKIAAALNAFNRTEYTRTVASVSRSLGVPGISVASDSAYPSIVRIVATWELCWYRYEVDLSDDPGSVRLDGQGYELGELDEHELVANAAADDSGRLYYE